MEEKKPLKFECHKCGNCCKAFEVDETDNFEPGFNGNPIVFTYSKPTLALRPWEIDKFPKENLELGNVFFDRKSERTIVLSYHLNVNSCPLLEKNRCSIYNDRPLACKQFPVLIKDSDQLKYSQSFPCAYGHCPSELPLKKLYPELGIKEEDGEKKRFNTYELRKNLYLRYGDSFVYSFAEHSFESFYSKILVELQQSGQIKLAKKGIDVNILIKKINRHPKIHINDFIKEVTGNDLTMVTFSEQGIDMIRESLKNM